MNCSRSCAGLCTAASKMFFMRCHLSGFTIGITLRGYRSGQFFSSDFDSTTFRRYSTPETAMLSRFSSPSSQSASRFPRLRQFPLRSVHRRISTRRFVPGGDRASPNGSRPRPNRSHSEVVGRERLTLHQNSTAHHFHPASSLGSHAHDPREFDASTPPLRRRNGSDPASRFLSTASNGDRPREPGRLVGECVLVVHFSDSAPPIFEVHHRPRESASPRHRDCLFSILQG